MDITAVFGTVVGGSNPSGSTSNSRKQQSCKNVRISYNFGHCGYGLVVEHVLAKDETRVRFPLAAQSKAMEQTAFPRGNRKTFLRSNLRDGEALGYVAAYFRQSHSK